VSATRALTTASLVPTGHALLIPRILVQLPPLIRTRERLASAVRDLHPSEAQIAADERTVEEALELRAELAERDALFPFERSQLDLALASLTPAPLVFEGGAVFYALPASGCGSEAWWVDAHDAFDHCEVEPCAEARAVWVGGTALRWPILGA